METNAEGRGRQGGGSDGRLSLHFSGWRREELGKERGGSGAWSKTARENIVAASTGTTGEVDAKTPTKSVRKVGSGRQHVLASLVRPRTYSEVCVG